MKCVAVSRYSLNKQAEKYAEQLIAIGWIDSTDDWSFTSSNGNIILRRGDWELYGKVHLGVNPDASTETREGFGWPICRLQDDRDHIVVSKRALDAVRQRASQENEREVYDAAGLLLERIAKKKAEAASSTSGTSLVGVPGVLSLTCGVAFEIDEAWPWDALIQAGRKTGGASGPARFKAVAYSGEHALASRLVR